jgi:hypothetical protein
LLELPTTQETLPAGILVKNNYPVFFVLGIVAVLTFAFPCCAVAESDGTMLPFNHDGKYGYLNRQGEIVVAAQYRVASPSVNGRGVVQTGDGWKVIDHKGKTVVKAGRFDFISGYVSDRALVRVQGQGYGLIDQKGDVVLSPQFYRVVPSDIFTLVVSEKGEYSFVNSRGELAIREVFAKARPFCDGELAPVRLKKKDEDGTLWGFINKKGDLVIKPQFSDAECFHNDRAAVKSQSGKWGYVSDKGRWVIKPRFHRANAFSEGAASVSKQVPGKGMKYGLIDRNGNWKIRPRFDQLSSVKDGVATFAVRSVSNKARWKFQRKYGLVDSSGTIVRDGLQFATVVVPGRIRVETRDKRGYVDPRGQWIWSTQISGS